MSRQLCHVHETFLLIQDTSKNTQQILLSTFYEQLTPLVLNIRITCLNAPRGDIFHMWWYDGWQALHKMCQKNCHACAPTRDVVKFSAQMQPSQFLTKWDSSKKCFKNLQIVGSLNRKNRKSWSNRFQCAILSFPAATSHWQHCCADSFIISLQIHRAFFYTHCQCHQFLSLIILRSSCDRNSAHSRSGDN